MPDAHLAGTRKLSEHCMSRKLKMLAVILALGTIVFAPACGTNHAKVRFVQASPDANGVDVAVDGKKVATNLLFQGVSPASGYLTVTAGGSKVELSPTGETSDLINSNIDFGSDKQYTVFATGFVTLPPQASNNFSVAAVLLTDNNSAPSNGNVKLRVLHAAP